MHQGRREYNNRNQHVYRQSYSAPHSRGNNKDSQAQSHNNGVSHASSQSNGKDISRDSMHSGSVNHKDLVVVHRARSNSKDVSSNTPKDNTQFQTGGIVQHHQNNYEQKNNSHSNQSGGPRNTPHPFPNSKMGPSNNYSRNVSSSSVKSKRRKTNVNQRRSDSPPQRQAT